MEDFVSKAESKIHQILRSRTMNEVLVFRVHRPSAKKRIIFILVLNNNVLLRAKRFWPFGFTGDIHSNHSNSPGIQNIINTKNKYIKEQ